MQVADDGLMTFMTISRKLAVIVAILSHRRGFLAA
jgi:hypothetical protein